MCSGMRVWQNMQSTMTGPATVEEAWEITTAGPKSTGGAGDTSGPRLNKIEEWD